MRGSGDAFACAFFMVKSGQRRSGQRFRGEQTSVVGALCTVCHAASASARCTYHAYEWRHIVMALGLVVLVLRLRPSVKASQQLCMCQLTILADFPNPTLVEYVPINLNIGDAAANLRIDVEIKPKSWLFIETLTGPSSSASYSVY